MVQKFNIDPPSEMIENVIYNELLMVINMILLNSILGDELNNYSYSEAFTFLYYFISLNLQLLRSYLLHRCNGNICLYYGIDYSPNKTN